MRLFLSSRFPRTALLAAALVATSACATKNDVRDLQTDLRAELRTIAARQDSLFSALVAAQDATRSTQDMTERGLLDTRGELSGQMRTLIQEIRQLAALAGQNQIAIQNLGDRLDGMNRGGAASQGAVTRPRDGLVAGGVGGDPDQDYADAMEMYRGGQLFGAQAAFEDFLGNHAGDELVPLVHFNLGDIHERNGDLDAAVASFERVGELYPNEPKVAEAEYRIGLIHMQRDEDGEARQVFQRIINTWGDSDDAFFTGLVQNARDRLEEIGG